MLNIIEFSTITRAKIKFTKLTSYTALFPSRVPYIYIYIYIYIKSSWWRFTGICLGLPPTTHRAIKCSVKSQFGVVFYLVLALVSVLNWIIFSKVLYHPKGLQTSYNRSFLVFWIYGPKLVKRFFFQYCLTFQFSFFQNSKCIDRAAMFQFHWNFQQIWLKIEFFRTKYIFLEKIQMLWFFQRSYFAKEIVAKCLPMTTLYVVNLCARKKKKINTLYSWVGYVAWEDLTL